MGALGLCMAAPALPHDVWLNIAAFLPVLSLRALYSVNSSLSSIAFDARYRQVSFIYWDDRLLRNLIRLRDPYIARRVKILHIYPGFLKEVIDKHSREPTPPPASVPPKPSSFRVRLADITQQLREYQDKVFNPPPSGTTRPGAIHGVHPSVGDSIPLYDMPPRQAMERLRERLRTAQDVMSAMLKLLRSLPSLTDYYVTWYGLHPGVDGFTNLAVPLIATPLLLPALTKLSLDVSLENIHALSSASSFHLSTIEELHLHLHSDHVRASSQIYTRFAHAFFPLSPHLRLLSIETHEPMDIGPFFTNLPHLSKLETLALALPVQKPHLGNPRALGRFLKRQGGTIKCLRIRATQHDGSGASSLSQHHSWKTAGTPDPWSLNEWIKTALGSETGEEYAEWYYAGERDVESTPEDQLQVEQDEAEEWTEYDLEALESLEVSSNLIPLETALYLAERFGGRVKSLGVMGSIKSFEFVKELLKVLRRSITRNITTTATTALVEDCSTPVSLEGDAETVWQWLTPPPSSPPTSPSNQNDSTTTPNCNLRTLKLGPVQLSPELFDLLAHNLPGLHHLELIVKHFLPSQDDVPIYAASRGSSSGKHHTSTVGGVSSAGGSTEGDGVQLDEQVYEFLETMQNEWSWSWWGLKTIAVFSESTTLSMPLPLPLSSPPSPSPPSNVTSPAISSTAEKVMSELGNSNREKPMSSQSDFHPPKTTVPTSLSSKGKVVSRTQESVVTVTSSSTTRDSPTSPLSPSPLTRTCTSKSPSSYLQVEPGKLEPAPHESLSLSLPYPILSPSSPECLFSNPFSPSMSTPTPPSTTLPLQSPQLPSPTTISISMSTPVSPLSSVSPSPTTPTQTHPYPHFHPYLQSQSQLPPHSQSPHANFASSLFSGGLSWTRGRTGGAGGSKPSQNSVGYAGGGGCSVSTSALPTSSCHAGMGIGVEDVNSGRRGSLASSMPTKSSGGSWRGGGGRDVFMGMGGNTGVGFVLERERERERIAGGFSSSTTLTPTSTSTPMKHGSHHVFSFLRSKSKCRKDKDKEKEKDGGEMSFGGAVANAHAGMLPIHGAAPSVAAAFCVTQPKPQQLQPQSAHTHIPIPMPPFSPIPVASATITSAANVTRSGPGSSNATLMIPATATSTLTSTSTLVPTPTSTVPLPLPSGLSPSRPNWSLPATANVNSRSRPQIPLPSFTSVPTTSSTTTTRMWVPLPSNQMFIRTRDHNRSWLKEHHRKKKNEEKEKEKEKGRERQIVAQQQQQQQLQSQSQERERERERERECARVRDVQLQLREREREKERRRERELERERERLARHHHGSGRRRPTSSGGGNAGGRRRRRKADPMSSFGSVSSEVSGISTLSGFSAGGGGLSDLKNANSTTAMAGVVEERITFEVALGEVLGRCLPGVRVVR